jgi:hypothetical protein
MRSRGPYPPGSARAVALAVDQMSRDASARMTASKQVMIAHERDDKMKLKRVARECLKRDAEFGADT